MTAVSRLIARVPLWDLLLIPPIGVVAVVGTHFAGQYQGTPRQLGGLGYLLAGGIVAPLLVRRVWPLPVLAVTTFSAVAYVALGFAYGPLIFLPALALYSTAAWLPIRVSAFWCGIALVTVMGAVVIRQLLTGPEGISLAGLAAAIGHIGYFMSWMPLAWVLGVVVRLHREGVRREREQADRRRGYEERLEVAREVHDIVGHGLAVINMQAGVALHVLEKRPEQARLALEAIRETSKAALQDVRGTLAVFREPDGDGSRRPTPGLAQLDGVVAAMHGSGLEVELSVDGERAGLPAAVDVAAYRIVQESLTNVLRHAGPARASVSIGYRPDELVLEVTDDGRARVPAGRSGGGGGGAGGHGIAGMRERAAALGGTLDAGPRAEGGFRVLARLPLGGRS